MNIGEAWAVDFPYEDDPAISKVRPCIIMDVDEFEVLSIKVTTHEPRDRYDVPVFKWKAANLVGPSYARVSKSLVIPKKSLIKKYGTIDRSDFKNIIHMFIEYNQETLGI